VTEREIEQMGHRLPVMDYIGQSYSDTGQVVIGLAMVIELVDAEGERGVHKITSDAGGHPLPWYACDGLSAVLRDEAEFDAEYDDE